MEEIWRDVIGYEGLYQVSNLGRVRSLSYRNTKQVRCLVPKLSNTGYQHVLLYGPNRVKSVTIHRLVSTTFIPNPGNLPQINHKDENKTNNAVDNLEWCEPSYNVRYSIQRRKPRRAWKYGDRQIVQLTRAGVFVRTWCGSAELSTRTGWRLSSILSCCRGERKSAYGFKWQFAN